MIFESIFFLFLFFFKCIYLYVFSREGQHFYMVEQHNLKPKRKLMKNPVHSTRGTDRKKVAQRQ